MDGTETPLDVVDRSSAMMDEELSAGSHSHSRNHRPADLSLILVSHNSSRVLTGFIKSLQDHPPACLWELVAVDNASGDDSVSRMQNSFPDAVIIQSARNCGFAAAVNAAAERAQGDYYLLVNPDITWDAGTLDRLVGFLHDHPKAAAVTPSLRYPDGRPQPSLRRFPTHSNIWFSRGVPGLGWLARLFHWYPYTMPDPASASRIEAAAAACLLVRASAFHEVGRMDEEYFLYVEDTDLCRRLSDGGWEIWIDPDTQVVHQWGRSTSDHQRLKGHHRDGIRRYFRKFHPHKHIRNGLLFAILWLADVLTRIAGANRRAYLA